jgi:hypothetical protein
MPATSPALRNDCKEALGETRTDPVLEQEPIASFSPETPLQEHWKSNPLSSNVLIIRVRANYEHLSGFELAEAHWHYRPNLDGIISALADRREVLILGRA